MSKVANNKILQLLCPNRYYNTISEVDDRELDDLGIEGIIIDLDNTLIPYYRRQVDEATMQWLQKAQENNFKLCIVSNNFASHGEGLARQLNIPAIWSAVKPRRRSFKRALQIMELSPQKVAVIGDQMFTDILGGNRLGMYTILVVPLSQKELLWTKAMRAAESRLLHFFSEQGMLKQSSARSQRS